MGQKFVISRPKSIVPALDVPSLEKMVEVVDATRAVEGVGGYKLGFSLALRYGLPRLVHAIRTLSDKPIVYDHQKAATDIPDTGADFAAACKQSGVDAVIFFPQAGPETLRAWIAAAQQNNLKVLVGLQLTGPAYLQAEGGFLSDDSPRRILEISLAAGVREFVVPGNKPQKILDYRELINKSGLADGEFAFHSPGLITQGGELSEGAAVAGSRWHAIIGRGIYLKQTAQEMRQAAEEYSKELGGGQ